MGMTVVAVLVVALSSVPGVVQSEAGAEVIVESVDLADLTKLAKVIAEL